jgi:UPF0716 protein FxsA
MRIPFSLLFLSFVFAEIAGFILVGEAIGVLPTLGLVLFAMVAGVLLLRHQGTTTLMRVRDDLAANRVPARPLAEGAFLAAAAILIIVPGFLTDILGLLLFVPFVRAAILRAARSRVTKASPASARVSPKRGAIVDLEQSEYGVHPRPDTPWRPPEA